MTLKRICFSIFILIVSVTLHSQSNLTKSNTLTQNNNTGNIKVEEVSKSITILNDSEPSPTPEEQGFTKFTINGRVIYRKVVDNVTIEFVPENN
jgi:DNA/RNA endonuclease YhcR with UshA esterase domain